MAGMVSTQVLLEILAAKDAEIGRLKKEKDDLAEKLRKSELDKGRTVRAEGPSKEICNRNLDEVWKAINELKRRLPEDTTDDQEANSPKRIRADTTPSLPTATWKTITELREQNTSINGLVEGTPVSKLNGGTGQNPTADLHTNIENAPNGQLQNIPEPDNFDRVKREIEDIQPADTTEEEIQWISDVFLGSVDNSRSARPMQISPSRSNQAAVKIQKRASKTQSRSIISPKKEIGTPTVQSSKRTQAVFAPIHQIKLERQ